MANFDALEVYNIETKKFKTFSARFDPSSKHGIRPCYDCGEKLAFYFLDDALKSCPLCEAEIVDPETGEKKKVIVNHIQNCPDWKKYK